MTKQIKISCTGAGTVPLDSLLEFQGELKDLSVENYAKLKKEILTLGFSEPIAVWRNIAGPKTKREATRYYENYILSGHQRVRVLRQLREDGYFVGEIPVTYVEAADESEAKRKVLALTSQYGTMSSQGLYEFMHAADIQFQEVDESYRFPDIDFHKFEAEFFEKEKDTADKVDVERCPTCGKKIT